MALRLYRDEGVDVTYLKQSSEAPTGVGFIMVEEASGRNCISIDPGANELLTAEDVYQSGRALKSAAVVVAQLEIPVPAAEAALRQGREQGGITILNPAPVRPLPSSVLRMVDILTPNQVEAKILAGQNADAVLRPEDAARELIRRGVRQVVMTLGEEGALLVNETSSQHFPAIRVKAVDTTGAGDAFNAGLATALANGLPLNEAVRFGVVTGGLAVTKDGVIASLPKSNDVLLYYRGLDLEPPSWLGPT
jgi:ribokinase